MTARTLDDCRQLWAQSETVRLMTPEQEATYWVDGKCGQCGEPYERHAGRPTPTTERYVAAVLPLPPTECWAWPGRRVTEGYGQAALVGKRLVQAHRLVYETLVGPIPAGLVLDHLCRNTCCVNPRHLEPVTQRVNILRGVGQSASNARKTHCPKGHLYDTDNTQYTRSGQRRCVACERARTAARAAVRAATRNPREPRTHCRNGHLLAESLRTYPDGSVRCRTCETETSRRARTLRRKRFAEQGLTAHGKPRKRPAATAPGISTVDAPVDTLTADIILGRIFGENLAAFVAAAALIPDSEGLPA